MDTHLKQQQFNEAMERYNSGKGYSLLGLAVSIMNCSLQFILLGVVFVQEAAAARHLVSLAAAYVLADFINGLVHLYMDSNGRYTGWDGPLVAAFHLHHKKPVYTRKNILAVYFTETGSKVWLVPFLGLILGLYAGGILTGVPLLVLTYTGILSSVAEVAHYLAHVPNSRITELLRKTGLLLSKKHHARHHLEDNTQYTFLNGMTDFAVNAIARRFAPGYKNFTDLHYGGYKGPQTENR